MAEFLQKQTTIRLKRKNCPQNECKTNNQDNIELIVFGNQNAKKTGFMCSQCLMDSQLLQQLKPIEKHSISIKKFMRTLTLKYKEYLEEKQSVNWGPNMLDDERKQICALLQTYGQILFRGTVLIKKQIIQLESKTLEELKTLYKDQAFQKLSTLLNQQDYDEVERINVSPELSYITLNIMPWEGQFKMSNEKQLKEKHEVILTNFRKGFKKAKECFQKLLDVQKSVLKELTMILAESFA